LVKKIAAAQGLRQLDPNRRSAIGKHVERQLEGLLVFEIHPLATVHRGTTLG